MHEGSASGWTCGTGIDYGDKYFPSLTSISISLILILNDQFQRGGVLGWKRIRTGATEPVNNVGKVALI